MTRRQDPPRRPLSVERMRPNAREFATGLGDLTDARAAGAALRAAARRRFLLRAALTLTLSTLGAVLFAVLRSELQQSDLPEWVIAALAALGWMLFVTQIWRLYRTDVADADDLRAATALQAGPRLVAVRDSGGAIWQWRHRWVRRGRGLSAGERVWITGRGEMEQPPHVVSAREWAPGRHVLWAALEREITRLPDPQDEHGTELGSVIDPDDPIS